LLLVWDEETWWAAMDDLLDTTPGSYYFGSKIHAMRTTLVQELAQEEPSSRTLEYAAQYALILFDTDKPKVLELLDRVANLAGESGKVGRRWAEDVVTTAWRLYVPAHADYLRSARDGSSDTPP
jgi:hypothetical protein